MRAIQTATVLLVCVALAAAGAASAAAAGSGSGASVLSAVGQLENALRNAVERQPEGLLKSVTTAERVCEVGERAEARSEAEAAEADWSALNQVVAEFAEPELSSVRRALREARSKVGDLERALGRAQSIPRHRVRQMQSTAGRVKDGIDHLTASLAPLQIAFGAWREHGCEAALAATANSDREARQAVEQIAIGMQRLWILAELANEGRR